MIRTQNPYPSVFECDFLFMLEDTERNTPWIEIYVWAEAALLYAKSIYNEPSILMESKNYSLNGMKNTQQ